MIAKIVESLIGATGLAALPVRPLKLWDKLLQVVRAG